MTTVTANTPTTTPPRAVRCRYLDRLSNQCTSEAVDPEGEVLLCVHHLGRALELVRRSLPKELTP